MKSAKNKSTEQSVKKLKGKTWTDKVNDTSKVHVVKKVDKDFAGIPTNSTMLIATPKIIDAYVRQIPKGTGTTLQVMRKDLAQEYNAEYTCPVTSGIFLRMVAEASFEQMSQGKAIAAVAPFWRIVDEKSPLLKKLSFGKGFVLQQRKKEGLDKKPKTKE